ncbi:MAG: hypothetical protein JXB85_08975 [Anaerolineales bacterium]|nr:hypothetical protein [Anaerolineales bacterium]
MSSDNRIPALEAFIVRAKAATYVGDGAPAPACRPGSHDLRFTDGEWSYLDSYFGGRDFIGEEVVFHNGRPVWAMNYYGYILDPELITPSQTGQVIKASLSQMYIEGRFLGGFEYLHAGFVYTDGNEGDVTRFHGRETIRKNSELAYELVYHGGLIKDA